MHACMQDMQDCGELPPEGICVLSLFDGIGGMASPLRGLCALDYVIAYAYTCVVVGKLSKEAVHRLREGSSFGGM